MEVICQGATYHVEIKGKGEPILLLHGFTGDHSTWDSLTDKLSNHFMCIMPDILGHGKSDSPKDYSRYAIEKVAEDLRNILFELNVTKVHVIGYSMGGRLALTFACIHRELVNTLILESASPGIGTEQNRVERQNQDARLARRILDDGIEAFVDYWGNIPLFSTQQSLSEEIKNNIKQQRLRNHPIGLANSLLGMGTGSQPSWWKELENITAPVLLITGEYDGKFCDIAKLMHEKLPNSNWKTVSKVGHAIHVEDSEMFGKIVSEFLEKWRV